ncbi:MAG: hypothetical protein LAP39_24745 [Acidobacteriia bacterium]|nr:hypothetical protein [Terriglobia bacterium]
MKKENSEKMHKLHFTKSFLAGAAVALACTATAYASGANRTFVATSGSDANDCSVSDPCRTFTAALAATASGGEIVVVNSGGYGPVSITQPVTISAIGGVASITQTTPAANAITINIASGTGTVTLIGLGLHGGGTGNDGIKVTKVGALRLFNLSIEGFANDGVEFGFAGQLAIYDSNINDNAVNGLEVTAAGSVFVHNTGFNGNTTAGVAASDGTVSVADSYAHGNGDGIAASGTADIALVGDHLVSNTNGITASAGTVTFANCLITQNTGKTWVISATGAILGSTPATSLVIGSATGALGVAAALQ